MYRNEVIKYKCNEKPEKEAIHSGHFMVSHFEAEEQDDEDELAVPVPETDIKQELDIVPIKQSDRNNQLVKYEARRYQLGGIDTSLSKLFQCMSLAYRQKLTSPKWNRFRGIRLRWKDKIRLNNVIWRCWHMQFIKKQNTLICQFASPLDVDTHNKPEAVVLEGKYWKRKLAAVTAEYKKWRMFYRNQISGQKESMDMLTEMELMAWNGQPTDDSMHMMVDEDYMGLMSDTLFSTITNQPFAFPDSREIAKAGLADFIQPSLGPLQPSLDDYMDTFELQDLISGKLPTVPEEQNWCYSDLDPMTTNSNLQALPAPNQVINNYNSLQSMQTPLNKETAMSAESRHIYAAPSGNIYTETPEASMYMQSTAPKDHKPDLLPMHVLQTPYTNYSVNEAGSTLGTENSRNLNSSYKVSQDIGYKFTTPATPNYKFSSQATNSAVTTNSYNYKDDRPAQQSKVKTSVGRGRPRSRSNTREPIKKPPLISVCSEPSLINSSNSALLTQLLINNDSTTYAGTSNQRKSRDGLSSTSLRVKEENISLPILPQPQPTTLIITTPLKVTPLHSGLNINDPLMLNTMSASNSPVLDSNSGQCLNSPTSSQGSIGSPTRENRDHRRAGHIHAEQKRRYNIKNGFDMIHSLIPQLNQNPNAKLSKAAMLQKAAEYIVHLKSERSLLKEEMDGLRQQIETLNTSISNCQSLLPATGAPVSRRRDNKMQEMFEEYVRTRTLDDWKFWIFSLFIRPLLASFNNFVSTTGMEDLYRSTLLWVEQHCTLGDLRPVVLSSLRYLCTKTDILAEPEKLPEEARQMVLSNQSSSSGEQKPM